MTKFNSDYLLAMNLDQ